MRTGFINLFQKANKQQVAFLAATVVVTSAVMLLVGYSVGHIANRWWLLLLPLPVILLGMHYYSALPIQVRSILNGIMIGTLVVFSIETLQEILKNLTVQPVFDFPIFWILGRAATQGQNFYHREVLLEIARPYNFPPFFLSELNGMYPPPAILLFMPLGLLGLMTAQIPWYILNLAALILAIIILWKEFLAQQGVPGLLLTAVLVVVGNGTLSSVTYGQINFLVLLMIAIFWRDRNRVWGGIWLSIAFLFKPFFGLMGLFLLLTRRWRAIGGILLAFVLLSGLAILVFGPTVFWSYFSFNVAKQPNSYYTMINDQSLLATILRVTHYDFSLASPMLHPLFLITVAVCSAVTIWLTIRFGKIDPDFTTALTSAWAALIFPHILLYYAVLLVPPILFIWKIRDQVPGKIGSTLILFMLVYGFIGFRSGYYMILTLIIIWVTLASIGFWFANRKYSQNANPNRVINSVATP